MSTKHELFKQIGWSEELINHFLVDDDYVDSSLQGEQMNVITFDTNSKIYVRGNNENELIYSKK